MKLSIRVGDSIADLRNFNRVSIEKIWGRSFLVGVRSNGRVMALFAVKPGVASAAATVMEAIHATIGGQKAVCVLSQELCDINDDAEAKRCIERHNSAIAEIEKPPVDTPNAPSGNFVDVN